MLFILRNAWVCLFAWLIFITPCYAADDLDIDIEEVSNSISEDEPKSKVKTSIKVKDAPPPGFEDLVQPQTTDVDVYYAGQRVGNTLATFTPDSIEFSVPDEVVALIPHLINPTTVADALTGPLDPNTNQVCSNEIKRECGVITPAIAGVIFNESRFRVDVFVESLQLLPQAISSTKFLPKVTSPKFSSTNSISSSISGEDDDVSYTVGANHIFSYGQTRLETQWNQSDSRDVSVENFSLQHDDAGIAKEIGFYNSDTRFNSFTNDLDVVGARIFGSTSTRTDLEFSQATEIFLFLNSRSRVEVFRDERLIDGDFYEAGNQQLNTARLPSGSYPILVRTTGTAGDVNEEQFFFVKTAILPPADQALHYFELGILESDTSESVLPELSNSQYLRASTTRRLQNNLGASLEFIHSRDTNLLQGSASYFGSGYTLQNSLMFGSNSEWGVQLLGQYRRNGFALNFDYRQVNSDNGNNDDLEVTILPSDFTQSNISANIPVKRGSLILRSQYNKDAQADADLSYGLDYRYPFYQRNRYIIEWNVNTVKNDDDFSFETGLRFRKSAPGQFINVDSSYISRETNDSTEQGSVVSADISNTFEHVKYGTTTVGNFASYELEQTVIGSRVQNISSLGSSNAQIERVDDDERGSFIRYSGTQNSNLLTKNKEFALGGDRNATSGVLLKLTGQPKNESFEIFVDGQPRGFAKIGARTVISLDAFRTYDISIRSRSNEILNFDENPRRVTLYPGNVETITYEIQPVTVLITRILLQDGSPASRMRIDNAITYALTDSDGWLQAEISGNEPLKLSKAGKFVCTVSLPILEIEQGVAFVDELRCLN